MCIFAINIVSNYVHVGEEISINANMRHIMVELHE